MPRKSPKSDVVAFKVEEELADFLNKLPNKSAFIRKAIVAQMSMACPLCHGSGQVSRWVHDHYEPFLTMARKCDGCGTNIPFPEDPGMLSTLDQHRLEQYFKGGPLYCDPCFDKAPECDDCGMHVGKAQAARHVKEAHKH